MDLEVSVKHDTNRLLLGNGLKGLYFPTFSSREHIRVYFPVER